MADTMAGLGQSELERRLNDLGQHLAYPPTPDIASAVRLRLAEQPVPVRRSFWAPLLPYRRQLAYALLALIVAAAAFLAVSPEARTAIAERLGLRGVQITQLPAVPTVLPVGSPSPTAASVGARLNLGQRTTLDQAATRVTFTIVQPAALGAPDTVYVSDTPPGGQVALVYAPRADLPAASTTGVGLLLTEFQGNFRTVSPFGKGLPPGTNVQDVSVNGVHGYWIDGDPHVFFFQDARGQVQTETTRLAANVLLWERAGVTLRIESALTRDEAVAIGASVR